MSSNRHGDSRAAYREVQERHADIQKIERTLTELAQLFNDVRKLHTWRRILLTGYSDEHIGRTTRRDH